MTLSDRIEHEAAVAAARSVLRDYVDAMYAAREETEKELAELRMRWEERKYNAQKKRDAELEQFADRVKMLKSDLMREAMTETARLFIDVVESRIE